MADTCCKQEYATWVAMSLTHALRAEGWTLAAIRPSLCTGLGDARAQMALAGIQASVEKLRRYSAIGVMEHIGRYTEVEVIVY